MRMNRYVSTLWLVAIQLVSLHPWLTAAEVDFQTGFEEPQGLWFAELLQESSIGLFNIQYQGGTTAQRSARLVPDPRKPDNQVLRFHLNEPNVVTKNCENCKGRIQANLYLLNGVREIRQRMRLFLGEGFSILAGMDGKLRWMTIAEFWNEPDWRPGPHAFRISVNIQKAEGAGEPLVLGVHGQIRPEGELWQTIWEPEPAKEFSLPIGEWFTVEYFLREGNAETGEFLVRMKTSTGGWQTVYQVRDFTHHPGQSDPDGIWGWNPLKLYTNRKAIETVKHGGSDLSVFWDDLLIEAGPGSE
jgi:hypothetical protein